MMQTLSKNWWLLGLCGVLDAIISVLYLTMYEAGPDTTPLQGWYSLVVLLSRLTLTAGIVTLAAALLRSAKGIPWFLVVNGIAFSAYGLLPLLWRGPLSFRLFAFLIVVMAMSFGILSLAVARTTRRQDSRLFGLAGAVSVGFALAFLALANGWIQLERRPFHASFFLWLCLFFGYSAVCMLGLAPRLRGLGPISAELAPTPDGSSLGRRLLSWLPLCVLRLGHPEWAGRR